jgi:hypothetical protein
MARRLAFGAATLAATALLASAGIGGGNGTCLTAEPLAVGGSVSDHTAGGTNEGAFECDLISQIGVGRWYTVVGDGSELTATLQLDDLWGGALTVYTCDCVPISALECVGSNSLAASGMLTFTVTWCSTAGETYRLLVHTDGVRPLTGPYTLGVASTGACQILGDCAPGGGDGIVDVTDLLAVLAEWGTPPPHDCDMAPPGSGGDGVIDVADLLLVLAEWSGCG